MFFSCRRERGEAGEAGDHRSSHLDTQNSPGCCIVRREGRPVVRWPGGSTVWIITVRLATTDSQLVVILPDQLTSRGLPPLLRVRMIHSRNSERRLESYRGSDLINELEILMLFVRNHMDVDTIDILRDEMLR